MILIASLTPSFIGDDDLINIPRFHVDHNR